MLRVLIVDDHPAMLEGLSRILQSEPDIQVAGTANNLRSATEAARALSPNLVLMDLHLPDGSGADAAREIRELAPAPRVLMLTATATEDALVQAVYAGCDGFVSKSETPGELLDAVRRVARGERVIPAELLLHALLTSTRREREEVDRRRIADALTSREVEVLRLAAEGFDNTSIGEALAISTNTVRTHLQTLFAKLEVHSKLEAVSVVRSLRLIDL
ncbi:MAG: response regulator transcription factor [Candidatus Dormibacteria bacterium]